MDTSLHDQNIQDQKIAIIGAGITGLTAAYYLLRRGADVTVFEAQSQAGGLAATFDYGEFWWDRFYHCILTSDKPLLELIDDLGLSESLRWRQTRVGFFALGKLFSVSTTREFLSFPLLTLWDKLRLAFGILHVCSIRDPRALESIPVSDWIIQVFGKRNYQRFWGPLLKCKLGSCREEASAAFMWATITRLYSTRNKGAGKQEQLGYVCGGYRTVFNRLQERIESLGGRIVTGAPVQRIQSRDNAMDVSIAGRHHQFDHVIATIPSKLLAQIAPQLSPDYQEKLNAIRYLGIVCFVLVARRPFSPFYVTNLCDEQIPFTGLIEMTNLIHTDETAGRHLIYLPKYTAPDDPLFLASEDELWATFRVALQRVIPDITDADIERRFLFRERFVQPLPVLQYSDLAPSMATGVPGLILANTTQIINSTLNNNAMVQIARDAVALVTPKAERLRVAATQGTAVTSA
jgi:protoporphyrinogen oxidase